MAAETDYKPVIIGELETMMAKEKQDRNVFKARAYAKVIQALQDMPGPVRAISDIEGVAGIGDRIRAKIQEILETGALGAAAAVRRDGATGARKELFMSVYGIGPVKAAELVRKLPGVASLDGLRAAVASDPDILNDKQKIGLKHAEDTALRIPRAEMEGHAARVSAIVRSVSADFVVEVVGSYRRGAADSGDIDVLLMLPETVPARRATALFKEVCERLADAYVSDILAQGPKKFMAFCRLDSDKPYRRLDLLLTPAAEYPYAVLYFTGSDKFNVSMRQRALDRGYTLNEHGMKPLAAAGVPVAPVPTMRTERDIFDFLDIRWRLPKDRNTSEL